MPISAVFLICMFVFLGAMLAAFVYGIVKLVKREQEEKSED